jgi:hypothetical protein
MTKLREEADHRQGERVTATLVARLFVLVVPTETGVTGGPPGVAEFGCMLSSVEHPGPVIQADAMIEAEVVHWTSKGGRIVEAPRVGHNYLSHSSGHWDR